MELNEQEAHCIARLLQSALFGKSIFDGCNYCKVQCYKEDNRRFNMFAELRVRLTEETGVNLDRMVGGDLINSDFPYFKFLKAANDEIKIYFRDRFSRVCDMC